MTPGRRAVLAAVSVNLVSVLPLFLTGAMAVQISRDFGLAAPSVAAFASLFALASVLGSAVLGRSVRILGVRRSLRACTLVSAGAGLACAGARSPGMLAAALLIAGLGNALGQPAGNALVAAQISPRRFGLGFAIKQSAIPVATTIGGLAVPLIALTAGWRVAYGAVAVLAIAAWVLVPADRQVTSARGESAVPRSQLPGLWLLAAGAMLAVIAATSIGALGAAGGVAVGLSEATAGYLVAAGGLAGLGVRLAVGIVADRRRFDSLRGVALLCALGAMGWAAMASQVPVAFAFGLVVANAFGWGWPGLQHLAVARRFPTATAAASGVSQTGVSAGLLIGPGLLGLVATGAGWSATWLLAAACALGGTCIVLQAARRLPA